MYSTNLEKPKIIFFGATGAGKSSVVQRLNQPKGAFNENMKPTQYVDYKPIRKSEYTLQVWDLSENMPDPSSNRNISHSYYRGSSLAVLCIDLSITINKEEIQKRIDIFRTYWDTDDCPILLLGTKSDTATQEQIDLFNELVFEDIPKPKKLVCSAKEGTNFEVLTELLTPQPQPMELVEDTSSEEQSISPETTPIESALTELIKSSYDLSQDKKTRINQYVEAIRQTYTSTEIENTAKVDFILEKIDSISQCIDEIEHPTLKILASIAIIAVITIIAAMIGFGIGVLLGSWSGPAAFFSGIAGASAAAIGVVCFAAATGLTLGSSTSYLLFSKEPDPTTLAALDDVREIAQSSLAPA